MANVAAALQKCRSCGETKSLEAFDRRADTGGHHTLCRDCRRDYQRERWRRAHPPRHVTPRRIGAADGFTCTRCGQTKPAAAFPPRHKGGADLQHWCRACFAALNATYYATHRETEILRLRRNVERNRAENQRRLLEYLSTHPCVDCAEGDPVVLEFDHLRDKRVEVSVLANSGARWPLVEAEIAKCAVRCANCHRIRTGQRSGFDLSVPLQLEFAVPDWSGRRLPLQSAGISSQICRVCGVEKPGEAFAFRSPKLGTRRRICKACQSDYHKEWYQRCRPAQIKRLRRNRRRARKNTGSVRERVWRFLAGHPCVDCGKMDLRVLDFDHMRDKRIEVGALVRNGASWRVVLTEIEKCEVRCANCHRRRTAQLLGAYRTRTVKGTEHHRA